MTAAGSAPGVGVELMITAAVPTPYGYVFRAEGNSLARWRAGLPIGRHESVQSPCIAYIVRHPAAGVILIDTGLHPDAQRDLRRDFGRPMSLLFRSLRPAANDFSAELRARGVQPGQVQSVLMTHLHVDHTSGMRLLPNATFTCSRPEWSAAHGRAASARGYVSHHLPPSERMDLLDFARDGEAFGAFTRTIDLLGDGTIRLISTPGHTAGHLSVLLSLADGKSMLVVGDAAYTIRNIREGILPMLTWDDDASLRTLAELRAFRRENPGTAVVPSHDPDAWRGQGTHPPTELP